MLKKNVEFNKNLGFNLVEFMISIALSMSAILVVFSVYVTSFTIDSKTVRYSRLVDEVNSIKALLSDDIKRAGYRANAENLITTALPPGNTSRCQPDPAVSGCADLDFRTLTVSEFAGEVANSCVLFAYDLVTEDGSYQANEAFGYRLRENAIEARKDEKTCTEGGWEGLTDTDFVIISNLVFTCTVNVDADADGNNDACSAANIPLVSQSVAITIRYSFNATLADDNSVAIQTTDTVVVRNASYN